MNTPSFLRRFPPLKATFLSGAYLLIQWPLLLTLFIALVILTTLGGSLAIFIVGLPLLLAAVFLARLAAFLQRTVNAHMADLPSPHNVYAPYPPHRGVKALLQPIGESQSWRDIAWVLSAFPLSVITWSITLFWTTAALGGLLSPILEAIEVSLLSPDFHSSGLGEIFNLPYPHIADAIIGFCIGLFFSITAPFVFTTLARLHFRYSDILLSAPSRDRENMEHLVESRDAVRQAEARSLQRIERDLHDGPQQHLVRLQMDLARAQRQIKEDPERAADLIDEALTRSKEILGEVRQLSRGIAPPVLVDRGLMAAIDEVAARSAVPVSITGDIPSLPTHIATAAYFVVAEGLVNMNKHSQANSAHVNVELDQGMLNVTVSDDGVGGARVAKGYGLAGLIERLSSVDGHLNLDSPEGGPTTLQAVIPCASL
ncbi:MAG: histidine kinase [Actinobacteria bacterium]|nr:MAG: histidine kinase [Actinomycetota bacterium]